MHQVQLRLPRWRLSLLLGTSSDNVNHKSIKILAKIPLTKLKLLLLVSELRCSFTPISIQYIIQQKDVQKLYKYQYNYFLRKKEIKQGYVNANKMCMWNSEQIFTHKSKRITASREYVPIMTSLVFEDQLFAFFDRCNEKQNQADNNELSVIGSLLYQLSMLYYIAYIAV